MSGAVIVAAVVLVGLCLFLGWRTARARRRQANAQAALRREALEALERGRHEAAIRGEYLRGMAAIERELENHS